MQLTNTAPFLKRADDRQSEVARLFELLEESRQKADAARAAFDMSHSERDLREAARLSAEVSSLAAMLGEDMEELQRIERARALDLNREAWGALGADFGVLLKEIYSFHDSKQKAAAAAVADYVLAGGSPFIAALTSDEFYNAREALRAQFSSLEEIRNYMREAALAQKQAAEMANGLENNARKFSSYLAKAQGAVAWLATRTQAR